MSMAQSMSRLKVRTIRVASNKKTVNRNMQKQQPNRRIITRKMKGAATMKKSQSPEQKKPILVLNIADTVIHFIGENSDWSGTL
jgi:hypothetical protein